MAAQSVESPIAGFITSRCRAAGARAAFAAWAAKRAAWSEIGGERGAGGVGGEPRKCVVGKKDGNRLLRDDVGSRGGGEARGASEAGATAHGGGAGAPGRGGGAPALPAGGVSIDVCLIIHHISAALFHRQIAKLLLVRTAKSRSSPRPELEGSCRSLRAACDKRTSSSSKGRPPDGVPRRKGSGKPEVSRSASFFASFVSSRLDQRFGGLAVQTRCDES